jgi:alkylation response protein AidB-like acyl-CoA dehydrogenase
MDFARTEEQELLMKSVRDFVTQNFPEEYWKKCDAERKHPQEFMKAFIDSGLGLLGMPEEYGGTPVDYVTMFMFCEEVSRYTGCNFLTSYLIYTDTLLRLGNDWQKETVMKLIKSGDGMPVFSLGISEPQAGSDNTAMTTTATKKGNKYYLNGAKTYVSAAHQAQYSLVFTRDLDNPDPHNAITMWMMPTTVKGVKINVLHKVGWRMRPFCEMYMENVELEEKHIVGQPNKGFLQLMTTFEIERMSSVAGGLGLAQAAFDEAIAYARQRVQFGKPIGSFQLVQQKIVDMYTKIQSMRHMLYCVGWERDNGKNIRINSAITKRYLGSGCFEVIDLAMKVMGTLGYTDDCKISRLWRDSCGIRFAGGTEDIMVHIAGRGLVKEYKPK